MRDMITSYLMLPLLLFISFSSIADQHQFEISIEEVDLQVAPGFSAKVWAFNGQVPGPLIHVREGDELEVTVHNNSSLDHTIHWHGVLQTNSWKSDGVPNITQPPIEPGGSYVYRFTVDRPGSLWYHCHVNVPEHVGLRGMWGPLIVDPKTPSELEKQVTKDAILMFSSWNSDVANEYGKGGHPAEKRDYFSINGKSFPMTHPLRVKKGDVLRLRLFGASTETAYHLHGHDMMVTHIDGHALETPYWADVVHIPMGSRVDVIAWMDNPGLWINHDHIEHHVSNNGKTPGGAALVIEYEGIEADDWYVWKKRKDYDANFYMSESLKLPYGMHAIEVFNGTEPVITKKRKKKKKNKSQ